MVGSQCPPACSLAHWQGIRMPPAPLLGCPVGLNPLFSGNLHTPLGSPSATSTYTRTPASWCQPTGAPKRVPSGGVSPAWWPGEEKQAQASGPWPLGAQARCWGGRRCHRVSEPRPGNPSVSFPRHVCGFWRVGVAFSLQTPRKLPWRALGQGAALLPTFPEIGGRCTPPRCQGTAG